MNQQFASVTLPEMRSILLDDPGETRRQLKVPVLALNGSRDVQVSARLNLPAMAAALAESGSGDFTVAELPGLNHLFGAGHHGRLARAPHAVRSRPYSIPSSTAWQTYSRSSHFGARVKVRVNVYGLVNAF